MPVDLLWDNEQQTALRYRVEGRWNWEDLFAAIAQAHAWMDQCTQPIDILIDMRMAATIPSGPFWQAKHMAAIKHTLTQHIVFVGAGKTIQAFVEVFRRTTHRSLSHLHFVDSLAAARTLLTGLHGETASSPKGSI